MVVLATPERGAPSFPTSDNWTDRLAVLVLMKLQSVKNWIWPFAPDANCAE